MSGFSVSVILPLYNSEKTVINSLDSLKQQTAVNCIREIIIVDDGSEDQSAEIVNQYILDNSDLPIKYIYQDNSGASAARNKGIKAAEGDFIALLDSDDIWYPNKLEKQIKVFKTNPEIVFLGTGYLNKKFIRKGKVINSLYKADLFDILWSYFPVTPSVMFKKSAIQKVGYFDENQKYCEDINYFLRFVIHYNYYYLPEKLVEINIGKKFPGEKGLTSNLKGMHIGELKNLRELLRNHHISILIYTFFYIFLTLKYWKRLFKHSYLVFKNKK